MFKRFVSQLALATLLVQMLALSPAGASSGPDITISSSGPSSMDISTGGSDVVLMNFVIVTMRRVTFENFPISLHVWEGSDSAQGLLNGSTSNFTDIKIIDTDSGAVVFGPVDATALRTAIPSTSVISESADKDGYLLLRDDLTMDAGTERHLALTLDVADSSALVGGTVYGSLELGSKFPLITGKYGTPLNNSKVLVPSSRIVSKTMTIEAPSLSFSLASIPVMGSNPYAKGSRDVPFVGVNLMCGEASDCLVTGLVFQGYLDDDGNGSSFVTSSGSTTHGTPLSDYLTELHLIEDGDILLSESEPVNGSTFRVTFEDLFIEIPAGDTKKITLVGDIYMGAFAGGDAENIAFALPSYVYITAADEEGTAVIPTSTSKANSPVLTYVTTTL